MKEIIKRLKNQAGETLVESMAAILIFTFASIIMLSMVSSAADINTAAREADREYFEAMIIVELAQNNGSGSVAFSIQDASGTVTINQETTPVSVSGDTDSLYAYYASTAATEPAGG